VLDDLLANTSINTRALDELVVAILLAWALDDLLADVHQTILSSVVPNSKGIADSPAREAFRSLF